MSRFVRRDRDAVISRLDRLLWVMEGVANEGWSKNPAGRTSPNYEASERGDPVVSQWLARLTNKIDDLVEENLLKLDEREERLVGTTSEIQNAFRRPPKDRCTACGRTPLPPRCPTCGASITSAGTF